jgi:lipopolysaccharide transport system permease protein
VSASKKTDWLYEIKPKGKLIDLNLKEIWRYRDLLVLFVKRDIVTVYKQTILGPFWFVIQPLFTSVIFTLIFNNVAGIKTGDGIPPFLFNLAGITIWNYFRECLTGTSNTFRLNEGLFSKVYFPRVIMPLSSVISKLMKFVIQMGVFVAFYIYYKATGWTFTIQDEVLIFPILVVTVGLYGLGLGMIFSSMTTKYRDISILIAFGLQLLMYISAVMYPVSVVQERMPEYAWVVIYNPLSHVIEAFRYIMLGEGMFSFQGVFIAFTSSIVVALFGLIVFNKTERSFIDTI